MLKSRVDAIRVIDSHDHTEPEALARARISPLFSTLGRSFIKNDLINAGTIDARWKAAENGDVDGWHSLKRYIGLCRNTGYFRCFLTAVRDLLHLDIDELRDDNWELVSRALSEANRRPDWYEYVLKTRGNIEAVLWDLLYGEPLSSPEDGSLFLPVKRFDHLTDLPTRQYRQACLRDYGAEPTTVADVLDIIDTSFRTGMADGIVGVKIAAAYRRGIRFQQSSRMEASQVFTKSPDDVPYAEQLVYQDFLYAHIIERSITHDLPIQVHTGMQSATGFLHNGYPLYLEEVIARYPEAKFVLLHAGYPFVDATTELALRHPNVYVDASWLTILSPSVYRETLSEWLDVLPIERIIAWGGDAIKVEMTYGSLVLARAAVTDVLAQKIEAGCFSEEEGDEIAHRIFRENIRALFRTDSARTRKRKKPHLTSRRVA